MHVVPLVEESGGKEKENKKGREEDEVRDAIKQHDDERPTCKKREELIRESTTCSSNYRQTADRRTGNSETTSKHGRTVRVSESA